MQQYNNVHRESGHIRQPAASRGAPSSVPAAQAQDHKRKRHRAELSLFSSSEPPTYIEQKAVVMPTCM